MDHYISREKTIEAIKTDLSQFVYDDYGNMTALGVRLIHRIGNITGVEPFGNLIDRDELVKDIEGQTERDGRTSSDVISKGVLEVFLDYIRNFPSARPLNEMTKNEKGDLISREQVLLTFDMYCDRCYDNGKYYGCRICRFRDARSIIRDCPPTATIVMDGIWEFDRVTGVSVFHPATAQERGSDAK